MLEDGSRSSGSVDGKGRQEFWRRWTGIEPAGRGSPVPPALKAGEPTRRSDTSAAQANRRRARVACEAAFGASPITLCNVKKCKWLISLAVLVAVAVVLSRKIRET